MHVRSFIPSSLLACVWTATCSLPSHAQDQLLQDIPWTLESMRVTPADPPSTQNVLVQFQGVPWVSYHLDASGAFSDWTPAARAAEEAPGHFRFHHLVAAPRQFYRAQVVLPGPIKTLDALYTGGGARLGGAIASHGLSFNFESMRITERRSLDLFRTIEQLSDALLGEIIVQPLPPRGSTVSRGAARNRW